MLDAIAQVVNMLDYPPYRPEIRDRVHALKADRPTLVCEILTALEDPSREHSKRLLAIKALGVLGKDASPAIPRLAEIASGQRQMPLNEKDRDSVTALLKATQPGLKAGQWWKSRGLEALIAIGAPAVPALENMLKSPDPQERTAAASALALMGASGSHAMPILMKRLLETDDPSEFIDLATNIEAIDKTRLKSPRIASKALEIAKSASKLNDATYAVHLLPIVGCKAEEGVPATINVAARAIREQGENIGLGGMLYFQTVSSYGKSSVNSILNASQSQDADVRAAAISLLAADQVWSEECRSTVLNALRDADAKVAAAAERVLQHVNKLD